jgi:hypothetical protein
MENNEPMHHVLIVSRKMRDVNLVYVVHKFRAGTVSSSDDRHDSSCWSVVLGTAQKRTTVERKLHQHSQALQAFVENADASILLYTFFPSRSSNTTSIILFSLQSPCRNY